MTESANVIENVKCQSRQKQLRGSFWRIKKKKMK